MATRFDGITRYALSGVSSITSTSIDSGTVMPLASAIAARGSVLSHSRKLSSDQARATIWPHSRVGVGAAPSLIVSSPGQASDRKRCVLQEFRCRGRESNPHAPRRGHLILSRLRRSAEPRRTERNACSGAVSPFHAHPNLGLSRGHLLPHCCPVFQRILRRRLRQAVRRIDVYERVPMADNLLVEPSARDDEVLEVPLDHEE
jgi:hypothetical protein